jgi:hypothetical protein
MIDLSFRRSKGVLAIVAYVTLSSVLGLGSSGFACGGGSPTAPPPPPPGAGPISGSWSGSGNVLVTGNWVEDQFGRVTGGGNIISQFLNCAHSTDGTHSAFTFGFNLFCSGVAQPVNYQGQVSGDFNTLNGALNGSGFTATAFTMRRQ